jgi:hypothetical protein
MVSYFKEAWTKIPTVRFIICSGLIILSVVFVQLFHSYEIDREIKITSQIQRLLEKTKLAIGHKDLFPLDQSDIVGSILVGIGLMIAASGGVGGGGILVPLLIIVFNFNPKHAIPLSNFTILGSSVTNMIINLPKRHPDANRYYYQANDD